MTIWTTADAFLGGRLSILQPVKGYRAGVDPVFLAAATAAKPGARVLDLGCGVGVAALCLAARVPDLALTGLERDKTSAALARDNAAANGFKLKVVTGDVAALPMALRAESFDHVITNPPYYDRATGTQADGPREGAFGESVPLTDWINVAIKRLAPKGHLTLIHRASRLPDLLAALDHRVGDIRVLPLVGRQGRIADRVLVTARKGARGSFRLAPPFVLHQGDRHVADGNDYTLEAEGVLRHAAPIAMT